MNQGEISPEQYRARRQELGLTQMQAASAAGISSQGVVSQIENGYRPGPSVERRLREALGLLPPDGAREPVKVTVSDAA